MAIFSRFGALFVACFSLLAISSAYGHWHGDDHGWHHPNERIYAHYPWYHHDHVYYHHGYAYPHYYYGYPYYYYDPNYYWIEPPVGLNLNITIP